MQWQWNGIHWKEILLLILWSCLVTDPTRTRIYFPHLILRGEREEIRWNRFSPSWSWSPSSSSSLHSSTPSTSRPQPWMLHIHNHRVRYARRSCSHVLWCRRWFLFGHVLSRSMSLTQGEALHTKKYWKFSFKGLTVDSWHAYKSHTSLLIAMCSYKNTNLPKREVTTLCTVKIHVDSRPLCHFFSGRSFSCCLHWGVKMRIRDVDAVGANSGLAPQRNPRAPKTSHSTPEHTSLGEAAMLLVSR